MDMICIRKCGSWLCYRHSTRSTDGLFLAPGYRGDKDVVPLAFNNHGQATKFLVDSGKDPRQYRFSDHSLWGT
jgi:hypothetical protein